MDVTISKIDSRCFMQIGTEQIEISDYNIKSSANGDTELCITICGTTNVFETSVSLGGAQQKFINI